VLYSSVGHAGASGYLAAMALFGVSPYVMKPTALTLNIAVALITTARFYRAGHFSWSLSWPFLASSVPLAFVGGAITLPGTVYRVLVGAVLLFAAYRMFWFTDRERSTAPPHLLAALAWGAVLGFISGLTGLGGGIFLSPLLLFMGWANFQETAGASSAFILLNSIAGLLGHVSSVQALSPATLVLALAAVVGALIGSEIGVRRLAGVSYGGCWPWCSSSRARSSSSRGDSHMSDLLVLVRGVGDIGSAVAHRLFGAGYGVVIHDDPDPTTSRRGMAFVDAVFDGQAVLEGVRAVCIDDLEEVKRAVAAHEVIPVSVRPLAPLLAGLQPQVLVDARMRKHTEPQVHRGLADFTIALGPSRVAGLHADVVIETSWDDLGRVITTGASLPLAGEPRAIDGHARDRYVYAPIDGVFRTTFRIGDAVRQGQEVAHIDSTALTAPLDGVLRGLTRNAVLVTVRTKVIEIDPRGRVCSVRGIAERPHRIADGVLAAIRDRKANGFA